MVEAEFMDPAVQIEREAGIGRSRSLASQSLSRTWKGDRCQGSENGGVRDWNNIGKEHESIWYQIFNKLYTRSSNANPHAHACPQFSCPMSKRDQSKLDFAGLLLSFRHQGLAPLLRFEPETTNRSPGSVWSSPQISWRRPGWTFATASMWSGRSCKHEACVEGSDR